MPLDQLRSLESPIVCVITADIVQDFAELNCGGRLTDDELRMFGDASSSELFHEFFDWLHQSVKVCRSWAHEEREIDQQILELVAQGKSNADIAKALDVHEPSIVERRRELENRLAG
jgi:hypothetical protein